MQTFLPAFSRVINRSLLVLWMQLSVACLLVIFTAGAGDTASRYNQLGHQLMCTCGCNQVLLECNHVGCTASSQMEAELRSGLNRGDSNQLILQSFVQKYGPTVLASPPEKGFDMVAWIAPGIVFLLGTLVAALFIRKWKLQPAAMPDTTPADPHAEAILAKIRRETDL